MKKVILFLSFVLVIVANLGGICGAIDAIESNTNEYTLNGTRDNGYKVRVVITPQTLTPGGTVSILVTVKDQQNNPVEGVEVSISGDVGDSSDPADLNNMTVATGEVGLLITVAGNAGVVQHLNVTIDGSSIACSYYVRQAAATG